MCINSLQTNETNAADGSNGDTPGQCSAVIYMGEVCKPQLQMLQGCLPDRSNSTEIYISQMDGELDGLETQVRQILGGLQLLSPSQECSAAVEPFICLYYFGLCDSSGELYLPSSGECETLTTETCASEWVMAQSLLSSDQLPQCNSLSSVVKECNSK